MKKCGEVLRGGKKYSDEFAHEGGVKIFSPITTRGVKKISSPFEQSYICICPDILRSSVCCDWPIKRLYKCYDVYSSQSNAM